jgi:hypothetical protein
MPVACRAVRRRSRNVAMSRWQASEPSGTQRIREPLPNRGSRGICSRNVQKAEWTGTRPTGFEPVTFGFVA